MSTASAADDSRSRSMKVDWNLCVGHGKCYLTAPKMFEPADDEGRADYLGGPLDPNDVDAIRQAEAALDSCPEQAISWVAAD